MLAFISAARSIARSGCCRILTIFSPTRTRLSTCPITPFSTGPGASSGSLVRCVSPPNTVSPRDNTRGGRGAGCSPLLDIWSIAAPATMVPMACPAFLNISLPFD